MPVVFTDAAIADLRAIRSYIAEHNPTAAVGVAQQIASACESLQFFPERGRPGAVIGTRDLAGYHPYVIVYRIIQANVEVLRIWHSAQDRS